MTHKLIKTEKYLLITEHHNQYNILAHLSLNGSPILEGVDLLPPIEDDVDKLATNYVTEDGKYGLHDDVDRELSSFTAGYNKAREKFLLELDKQILDFTHDVNRTSSQHAHFGGALFGLNRLKFYLSQYPTEFECEMDYDCCKQYLCCMGCDATDDMINLRPKTITTAQGVQWVGKYK